MNLTVMLDLVDRVRRSWWTVVAGTCLGVAVALLALAHMPKTYQAATTILIVPQQMPDQLVRSTVNDDMSLRMAALRDAVLSRSYMRELVAEVYGDVKSEQEFEQLRRSVTGRVAVENLRIDRRRGGGKFQLLFRDSDRVRAARVVNTLARLYVDQNVRFRTGQARETTDTIRMLAGEAEVALRAIEEQIADFKERHLYETDDHFSANLRLLEGRQRDLEANRRAITQAEDLFQTLMRQHEQMQRLAMSLPGATLPTTDPLSAQLAELRGQLEDLQSRGYTETHPEVTRLRREIGEFLEINPGLAMSTAGEDRGGDEMTTSVSPFTAEIESTKREIERLEDQGAKIAEDIQTYEGRIARTPQVQQELDQLVKDHEMLEDRYRDYRKKAENARAALAIEEAQQGERFEIIDEAEPPATPIRPVPMIIFGMGLVGGLGLFLGPIASKAYLAPTVVSQAGLAEAVDVPVLISISRLRTNDVERARRIRMFANFALSALSVAVLAAALVLSR